MNMLTTKQAGKALGVTDSRIRQLILDGRLPAIKFGRDHMILEKDLLEVRDRYPGRQKERDKND